MFAIRVCGVGTDKKAIRAVLEDYGVFCPCPENNWLVKERRGDVLGVSLNTMNMLALCGLERSIKAIAPDAHIAIGTDHFGDTSYEPKNL